MKKVLSGLLVLILFGFLFLNMFDGSMDFNKMDLQDVDGAYYSQEPIVSNMVTGVVVDYRSFDTLGEVTVLFVSSLGVAFILGGLSGLIEFKHKDSFFLSVGSKVLFPIIVLIGVFMFVHGHLTPGGGFPGGALIAGAMLLLYMSSKDFRANMKGFKVLEGSMGSIYVLIGIIGILAGSYFLENVLEIGQLGNLLSGGLIPIVYILIGLKVGSELTGIFDYFMKEEV